LIYGPSCEYQRRQTKEKHMAANPNTFPQLLDTLTEVLYDDERSSRYDSHTILSALALTTLETITGIAQDPIPL